MLMGFDNSFSLFRIVQICPVPGTTPMNYYELAFLFFHLAIPAILGVNWVGV